jgi:hypothetical protein
MAEAPNKHESDNDHQVWFRCFTAAIMGVTSAQLGTPEKPEGIARLCAAVADAALNEERRRRNEPECRTLKPTAGRSSKQ